MKEGEQAAIDKAKPLGYVPEDCTGFNGTELHYNMFESMISGRSMYEDIKPADNFRGMFKAQVIKDVAMAHKINTLLEKNPDDRFLVIAGYGHMKHYQGVPERVFAKHPELVNDSMMIVAHESCATIDTYEEEHDVFVKGVNELYGPTGSNPGDYLYVYELEDDEEEEEEKKESE